MLVSVETLPVSKSEFTVADERVYDQRSPIRWIVSHILRYKRWLATFILGTLLSTASSRRSQRSPAPRSTRC